eukprot:CAMPEP_0204336100 /NCGR_PEP_ID=MMETSP0469-20131031/19289_1 /ASSEMBLY_ACC=CAM_ASM_000384 /TAXON_ID=2969 /ORGANISM="Oxyrrhis marina" /LENGTH=110 /DNA_ID=CAMNT_0051319913 /DNA_START=315 /DNA_END=647 /DNA_ORIENTATION=-
MIINKPSKLLRINVPVSIKIIAIERPLDLKELASEFVADPPGQKLMQGDCAVVVSVQRPPRPINDCGILVACEASQEFFQPRAAHAATSTVFGKYLVHQGQVMRLKLLST